MKTEITSILRLDSWAGRLVLILYGIGTAIVAVLNLGGMIEPALGVVSIGLLWLGLVLLGLPQGEPFALPYAFGIVGVVVVTTALSSWNVLHPENPGYATWPLGAMTFLLFVVALRGRRGLAWIGFLALAIVSVVVALIAGQDVVRVINDIARQSATLLIGTLFAVVLRRAAQTITSIQNDQLSRAALATATEAATRERDAQNTRLEQAARPALERIISPQPFTEDDLRDFTSLAANLRGGTQASGSSGTRVADAVRNARIRGLSVTLIDDRGAALTAVELSRVETALLPLLRDVTNGSVTVRLSPTSYEEIATIVVEENGAYRRVLVTAAAIEVSTPN